MDEQMQLQLTQMVAAALKGDLAAGQQLQLLIKQNPLLEKVVLLIAQQLQLGAQMARNGAKLEYIKYLRCGGKAKPKKCEDGNKMEESKVVSDFKKMRCGGRAKKGQKGLEVKEINGVRKVTEKGNPNDPSGKDQSTYERYEGKNGTNASYINGKYVDGTSKSDGDSLKARTVTPKKEIKRKYFGGNLN